MEEKLTVQELQEILIPKENLKLPNPVLLDYYRLSENRIFYVDYEIDMSILDLQKEIIYINMIDKDYPPEEREPIKILIDSPGGFLSETMSVASIIIMSKTPIITINIAEAYSGAALLLMAGHKRYALPYAKAMIHTGSGGTSGTFEQTEEQQKMYKRQVDDMGKYILQQTGMDEKIFKKNRSREWYLVGDDQIKYGVVHEIIDNIFDIL